VAREDKEMSQRINPTRRFDIVLVADRRLGRATLEYRRLRS